MTRNKNSVFFSIHKFWLQGLAAHAFESQSPGQVFDSGNEGRLHQPGMMVKDL